MTLPTVFAPPARISPPFRPLTDREEQVLDLLVLGWSYERIDAHLGIAARTVESRIAEIGGLLENPEHLALKEHVMLWGVHRAWLHNWGSVPR